MMATKLRDHTPMQKGYGTELSPTWRDLAARDSMPIPAELAEEAFVELTTARIPPSRYTNYEYHRAEVERVWKTSWQMVCREEQLPEVGDHFVYDVAGLSFLVVRTEADAFKAFYNVCRHRGRKLVDASGKGAPHFRCGYHAWAWKIDGQLAYTPGKWDFPSVCGSSHDLRGVSLERWGGFLFINPDPNAKPLTAAMGSMAKHFETWPLEKRFTLWHIRKRINANWKVAMEAFLESYHVVQTHPQALPSVAEHGTQYDLWQEGDAETGAAFSRTITPAAIPSAHCKNGSMEGAIRDMWALLNGLRMEDTPPLPTHITDRASLAQWRREAMKAMTGADYSSQCDAMMLDSIQYWMFPNFMPWFGEGLPLTYTFRPDADTAETSYMDAWMLVRSPDEGAPPPAPAMIELGPDDTFEPHIGAMGLIFDQDDFNMPKVQEGMHTWPDDIDLTLGRYQESRIRFLHDVLEQRLAARRAV